MPKAKTPGEGLTDTWGRKNRKLADISCQNCGKTFRPKRVTSKYCSRPCMWANNGGHNKKEETWWVNSKGYVEGRVWLDAHTQIRVKKHRWVMENHIGRKLDPSEDVHHINEDKTDNRIENLELIEHGRHTTHHNMSREYASGYKLNLSYEERTARSERIKKTRAWEKGLPKARAALKKARGEDV